MENSDSFELVYLDPVSLQEGLTFSKLKRRQVKEEANVRSQKHEQRRRKFMRYQDTHQQKLAKEYFNNEVVGQILNKAVCEKKEDELRDIVLSYKNIFPQNRKNRQLQINLLEQSDRNFLNSWDKIETNREMSWTLYLDTSSQNARRTRLTDAGKYAQRQENQTMVREFLSELIDSALWIATCREIGGFQFDISNQDAADLNLQLLPRNAAKQADDIIPTLVLEDAKSLLISPLPSAPALPNLQSALVSSMLLPFNISERPKVADKDWLLHTLFSGAFVFGDLKEGSASQYAAYLAKDSWSKYVEQVNEGSVNQQLIVQPPSSNSNNTIKLGQSELIALNRKVTASRDAVLAPDWLFTYPPYHILGEVVVQVRCTLKPLPPQPDAHITTNHIPFRGALFGISDVYKQKTVDAFVSTIPRITIIRVESEVAELIRQYTAGELATDDPIHALAKQLSGHLLKGTVIPDSVYVKLIVRRVNSLPAHNNGYLLADYPQSLEQLLLLMEAFSAVRFDQHRPQPSDYASSFAPHVLQHWTYDVAKCGLDMLLSLDSPEVAVSIAMEQRINARKDLVTQEVVYIGPHTKSFKTLQKLYDPTRPEHTAALHIASAEENINQIAEFCKFHGLYDCVKGDESIDSKVQEIARKYIPLERLSAEYWTDYDEQLEIEARAAAELAAAVESSEYHAMLVDAVSDEVVQEQVFLVADEAFTEEQLAQVLQDGDEGAAAAPSVVEAELQLAAESTTEPAPLKESEPPRPPLIEINKLHPLLAGALNELWEATEQQCNSSGESFYFSMRDVRFQMLQRRRMAIDSTNGCMMRLDDRQDLFNQFRTDFNAVDDEMRFDPDCIAELHLKTLRLRNDLCKLCETRKQEMLELITTISTDNNMKVLQHRCYCEGAFFLQAEYNRFYIILQMMFDFGKYIQGYELHEKIMNELEDLLPITMEGYTPVAPPPKPGAVVNPKDAKKEKDKKGKDAANPLAPNRELLAPNVLPVSMMLQSIPTARTHEDPPPDAKAGKGKGKDKKGAEEVVAGNPFEEAERLILADLAKWKQGTFTVARELYEGDENLCQAIENAIWFEAGKMAYCIQVTKEYVDKQVTWLATAETECLSLLQAINHDRYLRELTAGEKVIDLIESCIANAEPLDMLWLVTPDASTPVQPASFWKKWRFLVPFVWLKQYEKAQKEKKTKAELAQMALKGLSRGKGTRTTPTIGEDEPLEDDELASEGHGSFIGGSLDAGSEGAASGESDPQVAASRMRRAMGGSRSTGRLSDATSSGQRHTSLRRPSTTGSSGKKAQSPSVGGRRIGSAPRRRGSSEAHLQRLRSPSINTTSRPGSGGEDQVAKEQERYLHQKQLLEEKLQKIRELRELDFRSLGMSPSAAKLAAFNELLLEEQHQLADLEAQWKPALARSRATVRGTIAKRPTMHGGGH